MANRAAKSGIALEAQQKMQGKWDAERAKVAVQWIGERIGEPLSTSGTMDDVHEKFSNGLYLAKLANWVKPGCIPASKLSKAPTLPFKQMELIGMFLNSININNGGMVKATELFQTVDLFEKVNMVQVILTIEALGRALLSVGREGYGKKESEKNERHFTEEQLKAGQNIIGLQMGSNKGASQAGQNFGKSRMIVD